MSLVSPAPPPALAPAALVAFARALRGALPHRVRLVRDPRGFAQLGLADHTAGTSPAAPVPVVDPRHRPWLLCCGDATRVVAIQVPTDAAAHATAGQYLASAARGQRIASVTMIDLATLLHPGAPPPAPLHPVPRVRPHRTAVPR